MALLLTMIIVMLYAILSHHYIYLATSYSRLVANDRDEKVAYWVARGGMYRARATLKLDSELSFDSLNEDWTRPVIGISEKGEEYVGDSPIPRRDVPEGVDAEVTITDEESRFNILLLQYEAQDPKVKNLIKEAFERLVELTRRQDRRLRDLEDFDQPNRNPDDPEPSQIYDGIVRYLKMTETDQGDDASFNAAKKTGASTKKNSPYTLLTIKELLMAERMTPNVLLGFDPALVTPNNPDGKTDEQRQEEEEYRKSSEYDPLTGNALSDRDREKWGADSARVTASDQKSYSRSPLPLADYITIWGDGRINVNTASREVLLALSKHLTWQMVDDILVARDAAKAREQAVDEGNEADPVEEETNPTNTDGTNTGAEPEDNRSFRAADLASSVAFYNRIYQNIIDERTGEAPPAVASEAELPKEWVDAFNDLRIFLTVRSRYFRVKSTAKVDKIRRTIECVYRRDQAPATPTNNTNNNNNANPPANNSGTPNTTNPPATNTTTNDEDIVIPDEPAIRLTLIYYNETD